MPLPTRHDDWTTWSEMICAVADCRCRYDMMIGLLGLR